MFNSAVVAVTPSIMFNSAVVAVTPSIMFNSAVVAVTPSNKLSSAPVEVTVVPATINEPRSKEPVMSTTAAPAPAPSQYIILVVFANTLTFAPEP